MWRLILNGKEVDPDLFTATEEGGALQISVKNQCLLAGEVQAKIRWEEKLIIITASRNALIAMGLATDRLDPDEQS